MKIQLELILGAIFLFFVFLMFLVLILTIIDDYKSLLFFVLFIIACYNDVSLQGKPH